MTAPPVLPTRLVDPELHATGNPHAVWRWMRNHAPVYRHPPTEMPAFWSLTRYEDIRAVYRNPQSFSSAYGVLLRPTRLGDDPGGGLTLALTDSPRHRQLRSLVWAHFNERSARALEDAMRTDVREVLTRALEQGECDFAQEVAARLSILLICRLTGVPSEDHETLFRWTSEAFGAAKPLTAHRQIMQYFIDLMYDRMDDCADDLMSMLVDGMVDDEPLTEEEILLNIENLFGATENAGLSIASGMFAFLEHPDQWQRLHADRGLLPHAVEEVLRWTSSATHSMRTATEPAIVRDQRIEAGDRLVLWIPSANHDEDTFPDPYRFDIARRPNRHLALGTGEHVCIGSTLARTQMRMLFTELLDTVGRIEQSGPMVPLRSITVSGPKYLPIRIASA